MKKQIILFSLLALCAMAGAQTTYRVVYIPGNGEHHFGFSLSPTFSAQHLSIDASGLNPSTNVYKSYDTQGLLNNTIGYNAGLFYGYETLWGNTIEWGNYTSLYYGVNPFVGTVSINREGVAEEHKISHLAQQIQLHSTSFITYRISDQISVSAGIGLSIAPRLNGKTRVDGETYEVSKSTDGSWILNFFNFYFDGNVGAKYWFTDDWFVGTRLQYSFFNPISLFGRSNEAKKLLDECNGVVSLDLDKKSSNGTIFYKNALQAVFFIGYCW